MNVRRIHLKGHNMKLPISELAIIFALMFSVIFSREAYLNGASWISNILDGMDASQRSIQYQDHKDYWKTQGIKFYDE